MSLFFLHLPWFNLCICLSVSHLTEPFFLSQLLLSHYIDLSKSRNIILLFWTHHCKRYYHAWVHEGVICFLTPFSLKYWPFPEQVPRTPCWTCSCPQELQLTLQSSVPKSLSCKMFPCRLMRLAVLLSHRTTAHNLVTFLLYLWHTLLMSERLHIVLLRPPVFQTELTKKLRNVCWVKKSNNSSMDELLFYAQMHRTVWKHKESHNQPVWSWVSFIRLYAARGRRQEALVWLCLCVHSQTGETADGLGF